MKIKNGWYIFQRGHDWVISTVCISGHQADTQIKCANACENNVRWPGRWWCYSNRNLVEYFQADSAPAMRLTTLRAKVGLMQENNRIDTAVVPALQSAELSQITRLKQFCKQMITG